MLEAQAAGDDEVVGYFVAQNLHGPCHPGARSHSGSRRTTKIRIIEVREPICSRANLAAHPALLPGHDRLMRTESREHRTDGITVADHDPIDAAHLPRLRSDAEPAGRTDQGKRSLRAGAGDLQR
ncbi:unannotated protein [freshwater metagenome]|uniref:Unannotated protein n=1 Tax=freshwater metagenome TaxID=449393 RepID=A0A6J7EVU3_9ZZZZ